MDTTSTPDPEMAGIQLIAGTFVHDFNNLFQTALGNLDLLSRRLEGSSDEELLNEAIVSVERAIDLTETLNLIGGKYPDRFVELDIDATITAAGPGLRERLGESRKFALRCDAAGLHCRLPPGQLERTLSALIFEGPAALSRGSLAVETAACAFAEDTGDLSAGAYVRITVSTDQPNAAPAGGLPPLDKGVGLLLTRLFAMQLGGACHMEQDADGGARVDLYLPGHAPESGGGATDEDG